jgi:methionyl-tRNA formyltransferase
MRIVIVTNNGLFAVASLKRFAEEQARNVCGVAITTQLPGGRSRFLGLLKMFWCSGSKYTSLKLAINVFIPLIARIRGTPPSLVDALRQSGFSGPVRKCARADAPEILSWLRELRPDVVLAAGATHRFNDELLSIPTHCAVNMHPSLLPRYAGRAPYFWCLMNDDPTAGVTIHITASKLDAGDIVDQRTISLRDKDTVLDLIVDMWQVNDAMVGDFFAGGASTEAARPQNLAERTFFRDPTRRDVRRLTSRGIGVWNYRSLARALSVATSRGQKVVDAVDVRRK